MKIPLKPKKISFEKLELELENEDSSSYLFSEISHFQLLLNYIQNIYDVDINDLYFDIDQILSSRYEISFYKKIELSNEEYQNALSKYEQELEEYNEQNRKYHENINQIKLNQLEKELASLGKKIIPIEMSMKFDRLIMALNSMAEQAEESGENQELLNKLLNIIKNDNKEF